MIMKKQKDFNKLALAAKPTPNVRPTGRNASQPPITDTRGSDKLEVDYFRMYESLYRKEVTDWQSARQIRRDPFNPITYLIQQLYKDAMLDNHLQGAIEQRILRVVNKKFMFKDVAGKQDDELSKLINKKWFRPAVRKAMG